MSTHLLTPAEAGRMLGISRETAERLMDAGRLPFVDIGTGTRKHRRVSVEVVRAYSIGECVEPPVKPEPLRLIRGGKVEEEEEGVSFDEYFSTAKTGTR